MIYAWQLFLLSSCHSPVIGTVFFLKQSVSAMAASLCVFENSTVILSLLRTAETT